MTNVLVSFFASFKYICYGSTAIFNSFSARINFSRQILTSKVDPRAERDKGAVTIFSIQLIVFQTSQVTY